MNILDNIYKKTIKINWERAVNMFLWDTSEGEKWPSEETSRYEERPVFWVQTASDS